jgi:integrase
VVRAGTAYRGRAEAGVSGAKQGQRILPRGGLSSKTVQNHLNFLHGIFSFAIKRGWAQSNPVAHVDRPKKNRSPHQRVRFLQPSELDELIDAVPDDTLGAVERKLYLTAALTGLRQGELLALKWLDIDWQVGRVRVADNFTRGRMDTPKSHEGRSVPLAARLARELEALHQGSRYGGDADLVFCHPETGHVLDPSKMRRRFKDALTRAGVREITFHELRHTFGTQMAGGGPRDQRRAHRRVLADRQGDRAASDGGWPGAGQRTLGVVQRLSADLRTAFPGARGFSPANLARMRSFALAWPDEAGLAHGVRDLPWGHIVELVQKLDDRNTRDWYAQRAGPAWNLNGAGAAGYRRVAAQAIGREQISDQLTAPPAVARVVDR